ncbi:PcfJ-like protein [Bacteroides heparinolyticus]|uniref:PcfJ-like protein n=1 Tax=Prevotella heparinolytica TaxID=28113 RepID=A0A3P2AFP5_9BACE|nr:MULTISPECIES: PcfJ domain-containing protein [Bacteroidales]KGL47532.1 PcfJ-like protein [Porphyromonas gulae]KGL49055.1 PcfJ-like protein [Porphyromonas cangingivalis]RRD92463.1 PcfJ-like protein [Bacteroides heparinolyticus]
MKPRNKFEKAVFAQSKHLHPITKIQKQWAFRECIDHFAYRLPKGNTTCMDCGHSWKMDIPSEHCTCPQCGAGLQVKETYQRKLQQKQYFTILTTSGGYQVLRMCLLIVGMKKGKQAVSSVIEIGQYWWNESGRQTIVAIQRIMGHYVDSFAHYSPMAIRSDNDAYRFIAHCPLYPKVRAIDTLRRNGFAGECHDIAPSVLITALLTDSRAETLMKAGRIEHLRYFLSRARNIDAYWQAYKITLRREYDITDIALWCDYVDMLKRLGKDIYNAHFICPNSLQEAHDRVQRKLQTQREREVEARKRQKALENEVRFQALKAPFFGIAFTDGTIEVRVLESVQEYMEESKALHHCVFDNAYYLKEDSLILSACINGKRIETIEVSLETMKVIQCRGLLNKNTEYHDRIIDLVHRNIKQIQSRVA